MQMILSELDFGLSDDSWIRDDSHIFGTLFYWDIFKFIQLLLGHHPFQAHHDLELLCITYSEGHQIYSVMNKGSCW
jgi:hypothetical protein